MRPRLVKPDEENNDKGTNSKTGYLLELLSTICSWSVMWNAHALMVASSRGRMARDLLRNCVLGWSDASPEGHVSTSDTCVYNAHGSFSSLSAPSYVEHHPACENGRAENKQVFDAPFFTTWFCTTWTGLFFPMYLASHLCFKRDKSSLKVTLKAIAQNFRDRGVTFGKFMTRCCLFCLLWVVTNYMYVYSLRILDCTDVMALYSAHVSFVYLLSWVILHDQFVGVRIVAVILCNTGIALLAYMDGITKTKTLGGVVLAAAAAAGSAVYKYHFILPISFMLHSDVTEFKDKYNKGGAF
ncbi:putative thiamine transporter SLC35F3 [Penaeus chinensis]|uniref:putative thiamine transporter SLC35F3 n=1 Tax=Penaeus chinensis TaxID=139456 RepID=UPI001FB797E0|nr:putative thiamine transporter SLC35F3 [Penaeus chinensis]